MTTLRKFGIEIECGHTGNDGYATAAALSAIPGVSATRASYSSQNYTVWQVKPDGSLSIPGAQEIVSPTLDGTEHNIALVRAVASALEGTGYRVNRSCGLHVHLDASDLSRRECAVIAWRYSLLQDSLKTLLPRSRWDGTNIYAQFAASSALSKISAAAQDPNTAAYWTHGERYVAVNLEHIHKSRSERRIEFRQAAGTVNPDKIIGWYKFLCDFVAETVRLVRQPAPTVSQGADPVVTSVTTQETRPAAVPPLRAGTDNYRFITTLEQNGIVTQADARSFGWVDTRLRVTAHALRRLGANIVVVNYNGEGAYVVATTAATPVANSFYAPTPRAAIFTLPATVRRVRRAPGAAPAGTNIDVQAILRAAPLEQGLSDSTLAWIDQRRAVLARRVVA